MATLQNVSGEPVDIPGLDIRVPVDGLFDVDDADAAGLEANPAFVAAATRAATPAAQPAASAKATAPITAPTEPTSTTADASASADTEGAN